MYEAFIDRYEVKFNGSKFSTLEEAIDAAREEAREIVHQNAQRGEFAPVYWTIYDEDGRIVNWTSTQLNINR